MSKLVYFTSVMVLLSFAFVAHSDENCVHTVYVKTANIGYAGTDANISLALYSKEGKMVNVTKLEPWGLMDKGHKYFERDNLDIIGVRTKCLPSPVCKIVLSHDNTGEAPAWNVDFVEVNTAQPQMFCSHQNFGVQQWLSTDYAPYQLSVTRDACGPARNSGKGFDRRPQFSTY